MDSSRPYLTEPLARIRTLLVPWTLLTPIISPRRQTHERASEQVRGREDNCGRSVALVPALRGWLSLGCNYGDHRRVPAFTTLRLPSPASPH
ncbi:hypothetical protein AAFF_G00374760 [Aldrovandia affinis]|uniref:Uncharacterized protein n=1 Tax=Aldrovandia affinis TaxID=143900 RepID=A0AAD7WM95_9TELE|nr:hypothetical protein AAFF_G00374760 [Aldrovandia affinis]